jgi:hypothetical protein
MAQPGEDKLTELRSRYEETVLGEIRGLRDKTEDIDKKVNAIELRLAEASLAEVKADLRDAKAALTRNNLDKLTERVTAVEKFQTRALAVLTCLNALLGLFAIFKDYILPRH